MPDWASVPPADLPRYLSPVMFGRIRVPVMLADLAPILERWRPGLLIHDSAEMAGAVAAEVAGIAHVEHSFGLLRPLSIRQAATDVVAPISAAAGVRNPGVGGLGGETYLDVCPPRLQFPEISSVPNVIRLRPVEIEEPPDSAFEAWLARRDGRPIVYLTMGTVFNEMERLRTIVDAIDGLDVDVVVTLGPDADPSIVGARPEHVHVASFIPQAAGPPPEPGDDQPRRFGRDAGRDRGRRPDPRHPAGRRPVHERRADRRGRAGSPDPAGGARPGDRSDSAHDPARRRTVRGDGRRLPGGRRVDAAAG